MGFFFKDDVSDPCFDTEIFHKIWGFPLGQWPRESVLWTCFSNQYTTLLINVLIALNSSDLTLALVQRATSHKLVQSAEVLMFRKFFIN